MRPKSVLIKSIASEKPGSVPEGSKIVRIWNSQCTAVALVPGVKLMSMAEFHTHRRRRCACQGSWWQQVIAWEVQCPGPSVIQQSMFWDWMQEEEELHWTEGPSMTAPPLMLASPAQLRVHCHGTSKTS